MNSKPLLGVAGVVAVGLGIALFSYFNSQYFGNVSILGAVLFLEILLACLWKFEVRFLILLMLTFVWAGIAVPFQSAGISGRWVVLSAGALVGAMIWLKAPRKTFHTIHLLGFFCVSAAFVSSSISSYPTMAALKALSLALLILYCSMGVRLAMDGREDRFFHGLLWGIEITVYASGLCYLVFSRPIWGNPNSLGAVMSIACFPILLWGWLVSEGPMVRLRRLGALLLCAYLVRVSMARAGMVSMSLVMLIFCVCLHQYKLLVKVLAIVAILVAITGMLSPNTLNQQASDLTDAFLYKGHKNQGVLGSRMTPWQETINSIKEHPYFGTGYGTSPTGEDPGFDFGTFSSSAETEREHGSSYITIVEWVGLLGVLPFAALICLMLWHVWKVCLWMNRTSDPRHYAIPLAMVVLSGFVHASFEDWIFAVGSYLSLFFWICAFLLDDVLPENATVRVAAPVPAFANPLPGQLGVVTSPR